MKFSLFAVLAATYLSPSVAEVFFKEQFNDAVSFAMNYSESHLWGGLMLGSWQFVLAMVMNEKDQQIVRFFRPLDFTMKSSCLCLFDVSAHSRLGPNDGVSQQNGSPKAKWESGNTPRVNGTLTLKTKESRHRKMLDSTGYLQRWRSPSSVAGSHWSFNTPSSMNKIWTVAAPTSN